MDIDIDTDIDIDIDVDIDVDTAEILYMMSDRISVDHELMIYIRTCTCDELIMYTQTCTSTSQDIHTDMYMYAHIYTRVYTGNPTAYVDFF